MKKQLLFVLLISTLPIANFAQSEKDPINLKPFLFGKFIEGVVLLKNGVIEKVPLNYNTDNQSVYFVKDGQYMQVTGLETIDTVYIQHKRFVPVKNAFYEVVAFAPAAALYMTYTNKPRPMVATTDHSGTTKQNSNAVSNTVSDVYVNRNFKGQYDVEVLKHFWMEKNGKMHRIDNKKQFVKLYSSGAKDTIENYIASHAVNFNNATDVVQLFYYCNSQNL